MPANSYFDTFLKENYVKGEVAKLLNEEHVFLDKLSKATGTGEYLVDALIDKNPSGHGATLADAQAASEQTNNSNIGGARWIVPWGEYNDAVLIPDKVMAQSASDMGAFFENKKEEIDGLYRGFADILSQYILRDSGHCIGYGSFSGGVITLTNTSDAVNFERGQLLVAGDHDGTTTDALLGSGSIGYVIAVNANAGTVTVSATSGGTAGVPASWTGTVYLFRSGDYGGGSSPNTILYGFGSFIPATDPSATAFCNVVRTVDIVARSGVRLTAAECAGYNIEQRLKRLVTRMSSMAKSKAPTDIFVHPTAFLALSECLEAKGVRDITSMQKAGEFMFPSIKLTAPGGVVNVWGEKFMPIDAAYAVNFKYMKLRHLDGLPKIVNGDGLTMMRKATSNSYEFRLASYPAFLVNGPGMQGRCPVSVTF